MQKFTRALTREVEVGGERLAVTFSAEGLSVRPVGARRPPHTLSWEALVCACTEHGAACSPERLAAALKAIKGGGEKQAKAAPAAAQPAHSGETATEAEPPGASGGLAGALHRIDQWLIAHRPRFHRALQPGASDEQLAALHTTLGTPLPQELRTWLKWHNGQSDDQPGGLEEDWRLMSTTDIAEAKRELDAEGHPGWQRGWLPLLDDGNDDYLCLDPHGEGTPVRECWRGKAEHAVVAPSLTAWAEQFLAGLERGDYAEDPERGGFHRRTAAAR